MSRVARQEGYSRRHRFSERGSFGPLLRGARKHRGTLATLHVGTGQPGVSRFGVAVTRRIVPSAVARNRLKRLAREAFRRHTARAAGLDLVLTLRVRVEAEDAFVAELGSLLERAVGSAVR
jgi:ribonuclease P protein component